MPGSSYSIEKNFINALPHRSRTFATRALYALTLDEMLIFLKTGRIERPLFQEALTRLPVGDIDATAKALLLTKLTYLDQSLLNMDQCRVALETVRDCFERQIIQDIILQHKESHSVFSQWLKRLNETHITHLRKSRG